MTKPKLRLTRISDNELIQRVTATKEALTLNAGKFPNAAATVAKLEAVLSPFALATQAVADGKVELRARVAAKNAQRKAMEALFRYVAIGVDVQARGDAGLIHAAGLPVTNDPRPVIMTKVRSLQLTPSVNEGELLARWQPVRRARLYEVQVCTGAAPSPTGWRRKCATTRAHCALNHDLISGQKVWVRVRALGTRGEGAWSAVGWKRVP